MSQKPFLRCFCLRLGYGCVVRSAVGDSAGTSTPNLVGRRAQQGRVASEATNSGRVARGAFERDVSKGNVECSNVHYRYFQDAR
jgi:hypothetical protein